MNQTNIAEARVGAQLAEIDMGKVEKDDDAFIGVKREDSGEDDGGLSQLAAFIKSENPEKAMTSKNKPGRAGNDGTIQAILASAGVQYTHENSEVIGSSKVEAQLSRRAEMVVELEDVGDQSALFDEDNQPYDSTNINMAVFTPQFNPPQEVMQRQFCSMAKVFGYGSVTDFALAVEQMTQEERRDTLDTFYKKRMAALLEEELERGGDVDESKVDLLKAEVDAFDNQKAKLQDEGDDTKIKTEASENVVRTQWEIKLEYSSEEKAKFEPKEESESTKKADTTTSIASFGTMGSIQSIFIYDDDDDEGEL